MRYIINVSNSDKVNDLIQWCRDNVNIDCYCENWWHDAYYYNFHFIYEQDAIAFKLISGGITIKFNE